MLELHDLVRGSSGLCRAQTVTIVQVEHFAGSLLLPYVIWLVFANLLNYRRVIEIFVE